MEYNDYHEELALARDRIRFITINEIEYKLQAEDPYGFWKILNKTLPEELKGSFTGYDFAIQAIEAYHRRTRKVLEKSGTTLESTKKIRKSKLVVNE
jgi:hypothetical protein